MSYALPKNEPIFDYRKGDTPREKLENQLSVLLQKETDISLIINGKEVTTSKIDEITPPFDHKTTIANASVGSKEHIHQAIDAALSAKKAWSKTPLNDRIAIFLKAADLISEKHRPLMNAATMIGQSKNAYQSEIDAVCELVDFLRFNAYFAQEIIKHQPHSPDGFKNSLEYRPLEGFVLAITPFNFSAIASNLCCAPALMGNTVVWKPAKTQLYAAHFTLKILKEAGLPDGVINMINVDGPELSQIALNHKDFAGLHFTGSTKTFEMLWQQVGMNLQQYKSYPRIVGETGGKDFILVHESAIIRQVTTAVIRGGFEFQGQKCSAASRIYLPKSQWSAYKKELLEDLQKIKVGSPIDFSNFVNAVIDKKAFDKISEYINYAKSHKDYELVFGGVMDDSNGYFISPTVFVCNDPNGKLMEEEIFGPVVCIYLYDDFDKTINLVDETSPYALTGSIFAQDEKVIEKVKLALENAAGNFYINDKPTGAVVNQQPFGGARKSGTDDKAGSMWNLIRWTAPRTVKTTVSPAENFEYPFMH